MQQAPEFIALLYREWKTDKFILEKKEQEMESVHVSKLCLPRCCVVNVYLCVCALNVCSVETYLRNLISSSFFSSSLMILEVVTLTCTPSITNFLVLFRVLLEKS